MASRRLAYFLALTATILEPGPRRQCLGVLPVPYHRQPQHRHLHLLHHLLLWRAVLHDLLLIP